MLAISNMRHFLSDINTLQITISARISNIQTQFSSKLNFRRQKSPWVAGPISSRLILIRYYSSSRAEAPSPRVITLRAEGQKLCSTSHSSTREESSALRVITLRVELKLLLYESCPICSLRWNWRLGYRQEAQLCDLSFCKVSARRCPEHHDAPALQANWRRLQDMALKPPCLQGLT